MSRAKLARQLLAGLSAALGEPEDKGSKWGPILLVFDVLGASGFLMLIFRIYREIMEDQQALDDRLTTLETAAGNLKKRLDERAVMEAALALDVDFDEMSLRTLLTAIDGDEEPVYAGPRLDRLVRDGLVEAVPTTNAQAAQRWRTTETGKAQAARWEREGPPKKTAAPARAGKLEELLARVSKLETCHHERLARVEAEAAKMYRVACAHFEGCEHEAQPGGIGAEVLPPTERLAGFLCAYYPHAIGAGSDFFDAERTIDTAIRLLTPGDGSPEAWERSRDARGLNGLDKQREAVERARRGEPWPGWGSSPAPAVGRVPGLMERTGAEAVKRAGELLRSIPRDASPTGWPLPPSRLEATRPLVDRIAVATDERVASRSRTEALREVAAGAIFALCMTEKPIGTAPASSAGDNPQPEPEAGS